ncbi:translation initiation factor IF-2 isoform X2 [Anser cygnoides]|uniref:translation initiation factor IF-2 isoform X2 n=1 Tax=Anser cygnoides TaxID=8845 RepID=UPI0034D2D22C
MLRMGAMGVTSPLPVIFFSFFPEQSALPRGSAPCGRTGRARRGSPGQGIPGPGPGPGPAAGEGRDWPQAHAFPWPAAAAGDTARPGGPRRGGPVPRSPGPAGCAPRSHPRRPPPPSLGSPLPETARPEGRAPIGPARRTLPPPRRCAGGDWPPTLVSRRGRVPPALGLRSPGAGAAAGRRGGGWCGCGRSGDAGGGAAGGSGTRSPARSGVRPGGRAQPVYQYTVCTGLIHDKETSNLWRMAVDVMQISKKEKLRMKRQQFLKNQHTLYLYNVLPPPGDLEMNESGLEDGRGHMRTTVFTIPTFCPSSLWRNERENET